jgi:hypothetical protein
VVLRIAIEDSVQRSPAPAPGPCARQSPRASRARTETVQQTDGDPYVRTVVLYTFTERDGVDEEMLDRSRVDELELVRETAGVRCLRDTSVTAPAMLTVEKMAAAAAEGLIRTLARRIRRREGTEKT